MELHSLGYPASTWSPFSFSAKTFLGKEGAPKGYLGTRCAPLPFNCHHYLQEVPQDTASMPLCRICFPFTQPSEKNL